MASREEHLRALAANLGAPGNEELIAALRDRDDARIAQILRTIPDEPDDEPDHRHVTWSVSDYQAQDWWSRLPDSIRAVLGLIGLILFFLTILTILVELGASGGRGIP